MNRLIDAQDPDCSRLPSIVDTREAQAAISRRGPTLLIMPAVPAWQVDGVMALDRKFHDGIQAYARCWPGRVHCLLRQADTPPPAFGLVLAGQADPRVAWQVLPAAEPVSASHLAQVELVLASGDDVGQLSLAPLCRQVGARLVYVIEYTLPTRLKIVALEAPNAVRRVVRSARLLLGEWRRRQAFAQADGLQANGTPAAQAYASTNRVHLYFDTRTTLAQTLSSDTLEQRLMHCRSPSQPPLQLVFSGRLERMKGADQLLPLAACLRDLGVNFHLQIFGAGSLAAPMAAERQRLGLAPWVRLAGVADFHHELMPWLQAHADLMVLPHPQGDPSCTYLETMACGVPILGVANPAWQGLLAQAKAGWSVREGDLAGMAQQVAYLAQDRAELAEVSRRTLAFARAHSFDAVFEGRVAHLLSVLDA